MTGGELTADGISDVLTVHVDHLLRQADAYAASRYGTAYRLPREAYAHMFPTGKALTGGDLGHVDSRRGPAVFYRLSELRPGDEALVDRRDGTTATFTVDRLERHPKTRFPREEVYYPTLDRELRLVTCGGAFDEATGHYLDNVVVFATADGRVSG